MNNIQHDFCFRYYKNAVGQEAGWNYEMIQWCKREAERQTLNPEDYWGGLVLDEMKIQMRSHTVSI